MASSVGELAVRDLGTEIIWKVQDLFNLEDEILSPQFLYSGDISCLLSVNLNKMGFIKFCFACRGYIPKVYCYMALKTSDGSAQRIPIREDEFHTTKDGAILFCEIQWTGRKEILIPNGELTVICILSSQKVNNMFTTGNDEEPRSRFGELDGNEFSSSLEMTWKLNNFLSLPSTPDKGLLSHDFEIPDGSAFFAIFPAGSYSKPNFIKISIIVQCSKGRGFRNPEMDCEVALRTKGGILYSSLESEDSEDFSEYCIIFYRYFLLSEVKDRQESLVPGGVLTLCVKLMKRKMLQNKIEEESHGLHLLRIGN